MTSTDRPSMHRIRIGAATLIGAIVAMVASSDARAVVTVFDVTGGFNNGSVLSGTITIDTAPGVINPVTALHLLGTTVPGDFAGFDVGIILSAKSSNVGYFSISAENAAKDQYVSLNLRTTDFVGYAGGGLCPIYNVAPLFCGFGSFAVSAPARGGFSHSNAFLIDGNLSPQATAGTVPEPASWALLLTGFGAVGVAARRRRVSVVA